jgi:hypothetical protein
MGRQGKRRGSGGRLCGWLYEFAVGGTVLRMKILGIALVVMGYVLGGGAVWGQGRLSYPAVGEEGMVAARNIYGAETGIEIL